MHIPEGILPLHVALGGYAAAMATTYFCIRKISQREDPRADIPKASLLTAAFFVVSLIHIPIPPTSVHLMLNGLFGVLLGPFAFPAILIGLFFQALMFGHGGLTTLGVNAVILGWPALAVAGLFRMSSPRKGLTPPKAAFFGFLAGSVAVTLAVLTFAVILITNIPAHMSAEAVRSAIAILVATHIPLILMEGIITSFVAVFFLRVQPKLLHRV